jgi:hypothetical protein
LHFAIEGEPPGGPGWAHAQLVEADGAHCGVETKVSNPSVTGEAMGRNPSRGEQP